MKKNIVLFLSIVSISLRAELLILKKTSEGLAALTREESLQYGPIISQIILKYQWPMCTFSNLTKAEQDALLTPGIQNAEEIFIQKKLQEAIPGLDIQVAFVPTTLYELFCIFYYLKNSKRSAVAIKENSINYEDNPFDRIGLTLVAQCQIFLEKLTGKTQSYFRMLKNSDNLRHLFDIVNITKDQVFRKYLDVNQLFFDTQVKISFDDLSDLPLFTEDDESAYLYVNNEFVRYCLQFPFLQGQIDGMALSEAIRSCKQDLTDQMKKDFPMTTTKVEQMYMTNIRDFWMIPSLYDDKDSWISLMIDFDYEAKLQNKAFLLRGTSFYEDYVIKHDQKVIKKTMAGSTMRYVNFADMFNQEKLYSVSFGQSLFAGFMLENSGIGACVYWYLTNKKQGYLLWVDKKEYVKSQNDSLFFISPLSTIAGLFGDGEFFHARTKIPLSKNLIQELQSNKLIDVDGLVYQLPFDYSGLLMVKRDPLNQAILFSDYIAKNGVFLNEYRPKLKNLETAQKEASRLYKDVKLVKSKLINWIDKYRNSKKAEEVSVIQ